MELNGPKNWRRIIKICHMAVLNSRAGVPAVRFALIDLCEKFFGRVALVGTFACTRGKTGMESSLAKGLFVQKAFPLMGVRSGAEDRTIFTVCKNHFFVFSCFYFVAIRYFLYRVQL